MSMDEVLIGMYITIQQLFVYVALYSNIGLVIIMLIMFLLKIIMEKEIEFLDYLFKLNGVVNYTTFNSGGVL